jgi:homoserine dehydrogenase
MTVSEPQAAGEVAARQGGSVRVGLLGVGCVGAAVARHAASSDGAGGPFARSVRIVAGLVRDPLSRSRPAATPLTTDARAIFAANPDVIVEVLGGIEPARSLVLEALARGIPVVTANKSLLAHHGDEIFAAAAAARVPLRYEAAVIAGVPFLGTLARRPRASAVARLAGIVNGTTNYILSRIQDDGVSFTTALDEAQRLGYAEPEPSKDVDGLDAGEKLVVLLRQLMGSRAATSDIETGGIREITAADLSAAAALGGTVKPVVYAEADENRVTAFAGPAFVPSAHPLAALHAATNGICLQSRSGSRVCFTGPGAGPDVTAITILDDVLEAVGGPLDEFRSVRPAAVASPATGWLVRLGPYPDGSAPRPIDTQNLLSPHDIRIARTAAHAASGNGELCFITDPCTRQRIEAALTHMTASGTCVSTCIRVLEAAS